MTSSLAAVRMTEEELDALEDTVLQMRHELDNQRSFLDASTRFHDLIAWLSGNALFGYIVDSLLGIMDGSAIGIDYPAHRRAAILEAHVEILDALNIAATRSSRRSACAVTSRSTNAMPSASSPTSSTR